MADLSFARPLWWLALLPLAACWWVIWSSGRPGAGRWRGVVDAHLLPHVVIERERSGHHASRLALLALAWLTAVAALAGPQLGQPAAQKRAGERALVLLIEIPEATGLAGDVRRNWESVRQDALALLRLLPGHETAVVLYSRHPFLLVPPTADRASTEHLLQGLSPGLLPAYGARPERALGMADEVLRRNGFEQADIVWLTAGDIASANGAVPPVEGRVAVLFYGSDGQLAARLQRHAESTGGFFHSPASGRALATLPELRPWLASAAPAPPAGETLPFELGPVLIALILPLALFAFRPGVLPVVFAVALSCGLLSPPEALADDARPVWSDRLLAVAPLVDPCWRAVAHYRLARYREAAALWRDCPGADAAFNRGNALARAGQFDEAILAYDQALALRADDADFRFNRGLVQGLLKPPPPPPPPPKTGRGATRPVSPDHAETPSADPGPVPPSDARRFAERPTRAVPETEQDFWRRLIELQAPRRKPQADN
ncbi:tetratricopeptide repeat protein [Dechloromonas sp. A34]|uniref:tetratricopeptide repeat protein n=1 Tax=Dechloromonas sp. A34 TaxID=447588 RepID=UPI002248C58D|nr:tetratricopeptide repeat protein [Dechloromonas sp. A34]